MTPTAADAPRTRAAARTALAAARRPADLFPDDTAAAARTYRRLARLLHPDTAPAAERSHAEAEVRPPRRPLAAAHRRRPPDPDHPPPHVHPRRAPGHR